MNVFKKLGNRKIKGIPIKYFFSPRRWASYIRGNIISLEISESYMKQFMFRYTHPDCQKCVKEGSCIYCGCNTFKKMLDPKSECKGHHPEDSNENYWGEMMDDKSFKDVEETTGLKFYQKQTKVSDAEQG